MQKFVLFPREGWFFIGFYNVFLQAFIGSYKVCSDSYRLTPYAFDKKAPDFARGLDFLLLRLLKGKQRKHIKNTPLQ